MYQLANIKMTPLAFRKKDANGMFVPEITFLAPRPGPVTRNHTLSAASACAADDEPSELPYLQPAPSEPTAEARRHANRAVPYGVVNRVVEERPEMDLAELIALDHRRYVLASGAKFKRLVGQDEPSTKLASSPAPHLILTHTTGIPPPQSPFRRRPPPSPLCQSHVPTADIKSSRRYPGAVAREFSMMMRHRVASKVWV